MQFFTGVVSSACLALTVLNLPAQPYGLSNRAGNATLRMPPALPVSSYTTNNAFGSLTFSAPVAIVSAPGETNRLFIVEQAGRIIAITNLASPTRTLFFDISSRNLGSGEQGLLGLAFHPGYRTNRFFFIFYTITLSGTRYDRLSRCEISPSNPDQGLTNTEVILISQPDDFSNHNAGDLHFGPDGYLYVSLGDEGDANDTGGNSQRINKDFFSAIMRLDVDKRPDSLVPTPHAAIVAPTNYAIPPNNPFIGATQFNGLPLTGNIRTEFWAVGLRNPWRFFIDAVTGVIYCGDVGQGAREEVDIIVKGGNYGWNYREGTIQRPGSGAPPAGFSAIPPILDYARTPTGATNVGFSITGGIVYRGNRFPLLNGAYVFGDYGSGNIWALRYDGSVTSNVPYARLMVDAGVAAFGIDPSNGDVLYANVSRGGIRRLISGSASGAPLPATLADTGAFTNLTTLTPNAGIVPYDVNVPVWSDNASASRWFYVPTNRTITFRPSTNWSFPTGSVWIQHFELELTNGVPESRKRLETRFLVRDNSGGVYGVSYRWDSATNATLVPDTGSDESLTISDGGTSRAQTWHYPSRNECLACHTAAAVGGLALGFNTFQLNRIFDYNGIIDNQLRALNNAGYFSPSVDNLNSLRALASLDDESISVEQRVRSYLAAHCASCHQPLGSVAASFDARLTTPLSNAKIIEGSLSDYQGDLSNRVVTPSSLAHSMLLTRITTLSAGRMPPFGSTVLDSQAIALMSRWITNDLTNYQSFADWQMAYLGTTNAPNADPDADGAENYLEYLTGTNPTNALEAWRISAERDDSFVQIVLPRVANRGFEVQYSTNLSNPSAWRFLDVPENRPIISATNGLTRVPDVLSNAPAKYYRARVFEP
jgi:glucose/arabinose dehydrogenase/mono/diheme cytochrome c family protein